MNGQFDEVKASQEELQEVKRHLHAANERARVMAGDLADEVQLRTALATELAGTVTALTKANHTADELRHQLRLAAQQPGRKPLVTLTDRGNGDGYALPVDEVLYNTGDEY